MKREELIDKITGNEKLSCRPCIYLGQFALNFLYLLDHTANFLLLGDTAETLSARLARARKAGQTWPIPLCKTLSFAIRVISCGKVNRDHCDHALDSTHPGSAEIWSWSTGRFDPIPESEVTEVHDHSVATVEVEPVDMQGNVSPIAIASVSETPLRVSVKPTCRTIQVKRNLAIRISVKPTTHCR